MPPRSPDPARAAERRRSLSELASEIGRAAATAPDAEALGAVCAERLGRLFEAERVAVLVDVPPTPDGVSRRLIGSYGTPAVDADRLLRAPFVLLDRAREARRPIVWNDSDAASDDLGITRMRSLGRRSAMACPIVDGDGVRGTVHVTSATPDAFDDEDLVQIEHAVEMLAAGLARLEVTAQLRAATAHAREVAARVHRLGPLAETLAGCTDERTVLRSTTLAVPGLFLAERGGVALVDDDIVVIYEPRPSPGAELVEMGRLPLARSVVGLIDRDGLRHLDERHGDPGLHPEIAGMHASGMTSWCIAPIREAGRIVGTINVATAREGLLDADEVELVHSLARLVGATLHRIHERRRTEGEILAREERLRELAERLAEQAIRDPLTGLRNRRGFEERLRGRLDEGAGGVLAFCDLDHFKVVNDREGHHVGDRVLRQVAAILRDDLPADCAVGRLGGDEFGVLFPGGDVVQASAVLTAIRSQIARTPFPAGATHYALGLSAGLVPLDGALSLTEAVAAADTACRQAKEAGRDRIRMYRASDHETQRRRREMAWTTRLGDAIRDDRLTLFAQPIVHLGPTAEQDVVHRYELLLRMRGEDGELIPPADFLPAAERFDMASRVDRWVVERALDLLARRPDVRWSANLSPHSVADSEFGEWLVGAVRTAAPAPRTLAFEVTETALVRDLDVAGDLLGELRALGCRTGLDDFGSGVASLGYLRRLPVDTVKLDGTLVREADRDPSAHAVLAAIARLADALEMRVIAEHCSRSSLVETVRALGIGGAQGYALGRPEPVADVLARAEPAGLAPRAAAGT